MIKYIIRDDEHYYEGERANGLVFAWGSIRENAQKFATWDGVWEQVKKVRARSENVGVDVAGVG